MLPFARMMAAPIEVPLLPSPAMQVLLEYYFYYYMAKLGEKSKMKMNGYDVLYTIGPFDKICLPSIMNGVPKVKII